MVLELDTVPRIIAGIVFCSPSSRLSSVACSWCTAFGRGWNSPISSGRIEGGISSIGQCRPIDFEAMITKLPEAA